MEPALFTFILDYKGGTYISQVFASFEGAGRRWAEQLDISSIDSFDEKMRTGLIDGISEETVTPITGADNVWCISLFIGDDLGLVHIIKTAKE